MVLVVGASTLPSSLVLMALAGAYTGGWMAGVSMVGVDGWLEASWALVCRRRWARWRHFWAPMVGGVGAFWRRGV